MGQRGGGFVGLCAMMVVLWVVHVGPSMCVNALGSLSNILPGA